VGGDTVREGESDGTATSRDAVEAAPTPHFAVPKDWVEMSEDERDEFVANALIGIADVAGIRRRPEDPQ
jgi:hypothetical protein